MSECILPINIPRTFLNRRYPGTVSTVLRLETGNEHGQPPVLHPFDVTPPVEAAYATQDVSTLTPEQSQIVSQSAPSFQSSPHNHVPQQRTHKSSPFHIK